MISEVKEKIVSFLSHNKSIEVVDVRLGAYGGKTLVQVLLDKEGGIGIDDLTEVNRKLSKVMDEWDVLPAAYMLEVSSAGLDRPLLEVNHFIRFSGRKVKVLLYEPVGDNRRNITGVIIGVHGDIIDIESDSELFKISFKNMKKANLVFEM